MEKAKKNIKTERRGERRRRQRSTKDKTCSSKISSEPLNCYFQEASLHFYQLPIVLSIMDWSMNRYIDDVIVLMIQLLHTPKHWWHRNQTRIHEPWGREGGTSSQIIRKIFYFAVRFFFLIFFKSLLLWFFESPCVGRKSDKQIELWPRFIQEYQAIYNKWQNN